MHTRHPGGFSPHPMIVGLEKVHQMVQCKSGWVVWYPRHSAVWRTGGLAGLYHVVWLHVKLCLDIVVMFCCCRSCLRARLILCQMRHVSSIQTDIIFLAERVVHRRNRPDAHCLARKPGRSVCARAYACYASVRGHLKYIETWSNVAWRCAQTFIECSVRAHFAKVCLRAGPGPKAVIQFFVYASSCLYKYIIASPSLPEGFILSHVCFSERVCCWCLSVGTQNKKLCCHGHGNGNGRQ